jgi:HK97 family phage major capsid protein
MADFYVKSGAGAIQESSRAWSIAEKMVPTRDAVAANAFPVAFGNFRRAYILADHAAAGLRVSVDDNITTPGYVKFYIRKRVGGKVSNNEAIKLLKCAAS